VSATRAVVADASTVRPEWDALAERAGAAPWLHPGWVLAWQRAFAPRSTLELVCVRDGDRLVAALPLVHAGRVVEAPANSETPFFGPLAEHPDALAELASALFSRAWRRVTMWPVESGRDSSVLERAAATHRYSSASRVIGRSPFIPLAPGWESYRAERATKMLSEIRRRRRRLEADGELSFEVSDGREALRERLDEGLRVEAAGWKGRDKTAIATRAAARAFYEDVCEWAVRRGMLRLAFVRLDGRAIAFDLCFEDNGVHYLLKTSYDPKLARYGPGALIRHDMIERAFTLGLERYEFLGHDEPWKHQWATDFRQRILVRFFAPTARGRFEKVLYSRVRPLVRSALDAALKSRT
jgi:CelD/BcsL family acetyltransferase involved in cellulose biosynthesis